MEEPEELTIVERRRRRELAETLRVLDSCMGAYYGGSVHMYRAIAGQLRILICDGKPLITRVFPLFGLSRLAEVQYMPVEDLELFPGHPQRLGVAAPDEYVMRLARMPLEITEYENGLQIADLDIVSEEPIHLSDWVEQEVFRYPMIITIRDVVRSVADKGGGAHVDDKVNAVLARLSRVGPSGLGFHKLLVVGIARLIHRLGVAYLYHAEVHGLERISLEDLMQCDPAHPVIVDAARVPEELAQKRHSKYRSLILKREA